MDKKTQIILCNGRKVNGTAHYTKGGDFVFYSVPLSTLKRHYGSGAIDVSYALDGRSLCADVLA